MKNELRGTHAAIVTPFKEDQDAPNKGCATG